MKENGASPRPPTARLVHDRSTTSTVSPGSSSGQRMDGPSSSCSTGRATRPSFL